jgi:hypothetical protein
MVAVRAGRTEVQDVPEDTPRRSRPERKEGSMLSASIEVQPAQPPPPDRSVVKGDRRLTMPGLDTGNTGFMLLCTSLVMLMTPGLAFFYGGLVGRKNVLAIMIQSFVSMGWTTVIWFAVGYSLCFSGDVGGVIGNLDKAFLNGVRLDSPAPLNPSIPELVFFAYQMMFAIITPALITGAFANRVTF